MNNWLDIEIKKLGRIVTGKTPPTADRSFFDGPYHFVSPKDLDFDSSFIKSTLTTVTEKAIEKFKNQILPENSVMFTSLSYGFGKMGITNSICLTNQQINSIIVDDSKHDFRFVYYLLRHYKDKIFAFNAGIVTPIVPKSVFEKIHVRVPESKTLQRKIAGILSAYDDLIENNLKRIKLLEEKARIEFKLIQKSENLEFRKAFEVLQFSTGKLNSNAAVANGAYPFFTCGQEILRTNTFSVDEEVVLLGGNNASAIYPVFYYKGKFDAYQRTYIIRPNPDIFISFKFLYFFWESKLDYLKNISTGAATKFLTLKILNDIDVPLPNNKVMKDYEILTEPIFKLKAILSEQNAKLRNARDILLPKLMNGQIEV